MEAFPTIWISIRPNQWEILHIGKLACWGRCVRTDDRAVPEDSAETEMVALKAGLEATKNEVLTYCPP